MALAATVWNGELNSGLRAVMNIIYCEGRGGKWVCAEQLTEWNGAVKLLLTCVCVCVCVLTGEEVSVAVGLAASLLIVGHGRHLLGRGAAHGLTLWNLSSSHSHLAEDKDKADTKFRKHCYVPKNRTSQKYCTVIVQMTNTRRLPSSSLFQTNWVNQCKILHVELGC